MVPFRVDLGSTELLPAGNSEAVGKFLDFRAHAAQIFRHGPDAVALLHAQLFSPPYFESIFRLRSQNSQDGHLVDQRRHFLFGYREGGQVAGADVQVADQFTMNHLHVRNLEVASGADQKVEQGRARRVQSDVSQRQVGVGRDERRRDPKRRRREIARHVQ